MIDPSYLKLLIFGLLSWAIRIVCHHFRLVRTICAGYTNTDGKIQPASDNNVICEAKIDDYPTSSADTIIIERKQFTRYMYTILINKNCNFLMFMCKLLIRFPFINDYIPVINLTEREYGIKASKVGIMCVRVDVGKAGRTSRVLIGLCRCPC